MDAARPVYRLGQCGTDVRGDVGQSLFDVLRRHPHRVRRDTVEPLAELESCGSAALPDRVYHRPDLLQDSVDIGGAARQRPAELGGGGIAAAKVGAGKHGH
jgi:hypothetical protein